MVPKGQQLTFLYTDNLARAVGFYRDVLDLELVVDQGRAVLFRVNDGAYLGVSDRPDRPRGTAGVMVSFVCDVDRAYAKLTARGVAFEGPPGAQMDGTVYAAFFRDPDGYRLELQEFRDPRWDALFAVGDGARLYSGAPFEAQAGYARAVVAGELVHVSGTTGFDPDTLAFPDDVETQCENAFANIARALAQAGCGLDDLVRVRVFAATRDEFHRVKPIVKRWCDRARPANTSVICALDQPFMRIEVEATARRPRR
ncbi:MAG: Rid family hydrolase [Alphaproteobacteria bacterium]